jgi:hypothetical protein
MGKIKKIFPHIFLITLALFIYHRWLNFSIFRYGDYGFSFAATLKEYFSPMVWSNGGIDSVFWRLPWNFLYGVFGKLGFDSNIADRFLLLWPVVVILPIASFLLVRKITGSNVGAVIGSFVFSYNTYYLAIDTQGQLLITLAGGFAVLAVWLLIKTLEERSSYLAIVTGLILFVTSFLDLRVAYMTVILLFFYALYYTFVINFSSNFRKNLRPVSFVFIPIVIVMLLNFYWAIGLLSGTSVLSSGILERGLFGNNFWSLKEAITLFHPFWNSGQPIWFIVQGIPFYFWAIPIIAFFGLWLNRKSPRVLFFGFVSLLGIFLTKQVDAPSGGVYYWLFVHFPGFNAFREASKFYFLIALGYSVLIGSFVSWIWRNWKEKKWQIYGKYFFVLLISLLFLWNTKPIITGEIGSMWTPRHIEQDYFTLNNFLNKQPGYFVTLAVPSGSDWEMVSANHPSASLVQLGGGNWKAFVDYADHDIYTWPIQEQIVDPLKKPFLNQLTDVSSIKYVIVPIQDLANDNPFFWYGGDTNLNIRQWYIDQLDHVGWLKKIDIGTKDLVVYENENYRSHVYITAERETIYKDIPYQNVVSVQKNPTEYTVQLSNISAPVFVNFSDNFDPNWKIRIGAFAWDKVFGKNYFLPDGFHSESDAMLNSFYIDPNYIRQNLPSSAYKVNPDGSIDLDLTIYFKPQSYFYLGLIISGTALLGCFGYLGWDFVKRRKKNLTDTDIIKAKENV